MTAPHRSLARLAACAAFLAAPLLGSAAQAQIKEPGAHPHYSVELEPHLVVQWTNELTGDDGLGVGMRATIPLMENGPVPKINNNIGIGFGLDWAHFDNDCWGYYGNNRGLGFNCRDFNVSGNDFWFPAVAQWNFFFTPVVSLFGEAGFGIEYSTWSWDCPAGFNCNADDSDIDVEPFFGVGPRFLFGDTVGLTLRLGTPYLSIGASILL